MISSRIYIQILVAVISGIFLVVAAAIPFFLNHPTETIKKPNFAIPVGGDDFKDTGLKINNNDIVEISCDGRYRIGQGKEGG